MIVPGRLAHGLGIALVMLAWSATACSGDTLEPADNADGKIAPPSASMRWVQFRAAQSDPPHVIRRYFAPTSPGTVRLFYLGELERRGWKQLPGGDLSYVEWTRNGWKIQLVFEPPSADGAEWSVLLDAPE